MTVALNQPARITFKTYSDSAKTTLADATAVVLSLKDPTTGTVTTPSVTHDSTGTYHYDLPDDTAGLWLYRWVATGTVATSSLTGAVNISEAFPPMLVGLDDVKTDTNITATTDDDELLTFIYTASAILLNHPAYRVGDACKVATYTDELHDGGSDTIVLDHYPVTAVTTVTEYTPTAQVIAAEPLGTNPYTSYGYRLQANNGILTRTSGGIPYRWCGQVLVTYTAGAATIPWDIRVGALLLIEHLWETQRGTAPGLPAGLEAESLSGSFGEAYGPSYILPNRVTEALTAYRKAPATA